MREIFTAFYCDHSSGINKLNIIETVSVSVFTFIKCNRDSLSLSLHLYEV